ncbi:MAG: AAA family ATPase [Candidatus Hermodarchaeota archaeon]
MKNPKDLFGMSNIFKNESLFVKSFIFNRIPHREKELSLLSQLFLSLITDPKKVSRKILVTGQLHTGKTTTILFLAKTLVDAARKRNLVINYMYIDCKEHNTRDNVLSKIKYDLDDSNKPKTIPLITDKLRARNRYPKSKPQLLLILDDLDYFDDDPEELFNSLDIEYELSASCGNWLSIISIVSDLEFLEPYFGNNLDILRRNIIKFRPFSREQIFDILKYRASLGMYIDAYSDDIINMITDNTLLTGDIRAGVELLWKAGKIAEEKKLRQITPECVRLGRESLNNSK